MHRIDTNGSVDGTFQDGNPAIGQQSTQLTSDWFNAVQSEIVNVIEEAGIALDKQDNAQLYAAIIALIAGVVGDGSGAVPTVRQVLTAGLATGGGNLAADRTITVEKASAAEILAGLIDNKGVTPFGLAGAFGANLGSNGYFRLPGGLIVQWGGLRSTFSEGSVSVTFPTTFPETCFRALPVAVNQSANMNNDVMCQIVSYSQASASFYFNFDGSGSDVINGLDYIAIGK